jgi:hypothetical protein
MLLNVGKKFVLVSMLIIGFSSISVAGEHPWRSNTEWAKMPEEREWGAEMAQCGLENDADKIAVLVQIVIQCFNLIEKEM